MSKYYSVSNEPVELITPKTQQAATSGRKDYRIEGEFFGGAELIGKRPAQEDRMIAERLTLEETAAYRAFSSKDKKECLSKTLQTLNQGCRTVYDFFARQLNPNSVKNQGSTAIIALIDPQLNHVLIANVGDSQVFASYLNADGSHQKTARLNNLHNPDQPNEKARLEALKVTLVGNRLSSGTTLLSTSRSLGDFVFEQSGLSAEPEFTEVSFDLQAGESVTLMVACDGLTERECLKPEDIGKYIAQHQQESLGQLSLGLAQSAISKGSKDNVSVQACRLSNTPSPQSDPFILGVFDGHGGTQIAVHLKNKFMEHFKTHLNHMRPQPLTHQYDKRKKTRTAIQSNYNLRPRPSPKPIRFQ